MAVRTLIVDDEPTTRTVLRHHLRNIGCDIVGEAASSYDAAELIESAAPDLVTLDIHMPEIRGMDSYKLFRNIRRRHPDVEFIVISGANYFQNRQDFMMGGAIGYFAKPIDFRGLAGNLRVVFPELDIYRMPAHSL